MAISWKGSILDTYNDNKEFGGAGVGFGDAKKAGGEASTDFIKGVNWQSVTPKFTGDAAKGFSVKRKGNKESEFVMVKESNNGSAINSDFDALNTSNDYTYNTIKISGYNSSKRYKKPANP